MWFSVLLDDAADGVEAKLMRSIVQRHAVSGAGAAAGAHGEGGGRSGWVTMRMHGPTAAEIGGMRKAAGHAGRLG